MWMGLAVAALFGGIGVVLSIVGYFLFDLIEWRINFADEIKKGNMAAAIVIASVILGICFVMGRAVGGG